MEFRPTMLKDMSFQMRILLALWVYVILSLVYGCIIPQSSWFLHLSTLYIKYVFDLLHFRRTSQVHLKGFCDYFFFASFQYFCYYESSPGLIILCLSVLQKNKLKKNTPLQTTKKIDKTLSTKTLNIMYSDSESVKMCSCIWIEGCKINFFFFFF